VLSKRRGVSVVLTLVAFAMAFIGFVAAAPEAFAQGQAYKLGAGDKIRVVVLSDTDLSSDYEVDATGSISARMLGRLSVIGLTMAELETLLSERYRSRPETERRVAERPAILHSRRDHQTGFVSLYFGPYRGPGGGDRRRLYAACLDGSNQGEAIWQCGRRGRESVTEDTPLYPGDIVRVPERFF
jgi:hypothetical protein